MVGEEEVEEMVGVMEAVFPAVEGASLPLRSTSGLMLGSTALNRNSGPASSGYFSAYEIRLRHTRILFRPFDARSHSHISVTESEEERSSVFVSA